MPRSAQAGWSLVEAMVVIALLAIVASLIVPNYLSQRNSAAEARVMALMSAVRSGISAYEARNGSFSGLPGTGSGQTAYDALRAALSQVLLLPSWADAQRVFSPNENTFTVTSAPGGALSGHGYAVSVTSPLSPGRVIAATPSGVYVCSGGFATCSAP
jgi:type II secretory pathway pseudopilin PulG